MPDAPRAEKKWLHRFGWLILIWSCSVLALAIVALFFRFLMKLVGMTV